MTDLNYVLKQRVRARKTYQQRKSLGLIKPVCPRKKRLAMQKYKKADPIRRKAVSAVGNAVRDGKLFKKPCEYCGIKKVQAHHPDYSKPLDVRWLCVKHHAQVHVEERIQQLKAA